jgi:hypothetical protein
MRISKLCFKFPARCAGYASAKGASIIRELLCVLLAAAIAIPLYAIGERLLRRSTGAKILKAAAFLSFWAVFIAAMRFSEGLLP